MNRSLLLLTEDMVNRVLRLDPECSSVLEPLVGKRIALAVEGPARFRVLVQVHPDGIRLANTCAVGADVELRGSADALVKLFRGAGETLPAGAGVSVHGEIRVLEELKRALARLRLDWEEPIAQVLGDGLGHSAARGLRALASLAGHAARELRENTSEFLREESGWLVQREVVDEFCEQVDSLRDVVARLEKRLERVERELP